MQTKLLLLISVITLSYTSTIAQTPTDFQQNSLELSSGYTFGALKNLSFAPIVRYDYNALNHQLKYVRSTDKNKLFEVQLDYLNTDLTSETIPVLNTPYSKVVLNFTYLRPVYTRNKFHIHAGIQAQTNISGYNEWQNYEGQQKFGLAGRFTYQIDQRHSLSSKLTLPFFMWRVSSFEENPYGLGKYQGLFWNLGYQYRLSKHFDVKANYTFTYDRLQISDAYKELQQQLNLGVNLKF